MALGELSPPEDVRAWLCALHPELISYGERAVEVGVDGLTVLFAPLETVLDALGVEDQEHRLFLQEEMEAMRASQSDDEDEESAGRVSEKNGLDGDATMSDGVKKEDGRPNPQVAHLAPGAVSVSGSQNSAGTDWGRGSEQRGGKLNLQLDLGPRSRALSVALSKGDPSTSVVRAYCYYCYYNCYYLMERELYLLCSYFEFTGLHTTHTHIHNTYKYTTRPHNMHTHAHTKYTYIYIHTHTYINSLTHSLIHT